MLTPRQFLDTRAGTHCAIGLILLVGASTGLTGLGWGLPSSQRAALLGGSVAACRAELSSRSERDLDTRRGQGTIFRAAPLEDEFDLPRVVRRFLLFTDSPDEALTLLALANLRPRQLDFNPRIVQYGGVHVYGTGAALAVAHTIHFGRITGDVGHYADRPQDIARLYVAGRLLIVCYNIGIALVLFAFGREAAGSLCGVVAALCWLLSPAAVAFSHIINPHLPAAFFATLAAWLSWRAARDPERLRAWIAAGAACGTAAACAPNAALAILAPCFTAAFSLGSEPRVAIKVVVIALVAAAGLYLAFNPYIFANVGVFVSEREPTAPSA